MRTAQVLVKAVRVERQREMGDLDALAKSIDDQGLIQPLIVTPDLRLISGLRRLAAVKQLGWNRVPVIIVDKFPELLSLLRAEWDGDDTERKPMLHSERARFGLGIEKLDNFSRSAEQRSLAARLAVAVRHGNDTEQIRAAYPPKLGSVRRATAKAIGWNEGSYERARTVIHAVESDDPELRARGVQAAVEMDATGQLTPAYNLVRYGPGRTKPSKPVLVGPEQHRALVQAELALSGIAFGFTQISELDPSITPEEAAQWVDGLSKSRRELERTIRKLRARANERIVSEHND